MNVDEKEQFKELIDSNINQYGFHITVVGSAIQPRYAYTIGLTGLFNFELVFSGGIYYLYDDLLKIFNEIVNTLKRSNDRHGKKVMITSLGAFSLSHVDTSWSKLTMPGVYDYYKTSNIRAFQIIPDSEHYTLDIPDMSKEWDTASEPVWQWLIRKWDYSVPENSTVATNINALTGETITELTRWEEDEWEMFAGPGPEVEKKDMRVVSLATILGIDKTILPAINLKIGKGLWREDAESEWNDWE